MNLDAAPSGAWLADASGGASGEPGWGRYGLAGFSRREFRQQVADRQYLNYVHSVGNYVGC